MAGDFEARATVRDAHIDLFNRYAHALDGRNWPALAALFTEDGVFGFSRSLGFGAGEEEQATIEGRDNLVAMITGSIECLSATHHLMSNYVVDVDAGGNTAEASAYFRAYHAGKDARAHLFEEIVGKVRHQDRADWIGVENSADARIHHDHARDSRRLRLERDDIRPSRVGDLNRPLIQMLRD